MRGAFGSFLPARHFSSRPGADHRTAGWEHEFARSDCGGIRRHATRHFSIKFAARVDDKVLIERDENGGTADAKVIAVQYHEGRKAVAVRFLHGPCAWVTQP